MTGYNKKIFRVLGISFQDVGAGTLATGLTLVDITAEPVLLVPLADFSLQPWVSSSYYRSGRIARGRLRFGTAAGGGEGAATPAEFLSAGRTLVTARMAMEFNLPATDAIAGATVVNAALSQKYITSGLQNLWLFNQGSGQELTDFVGSDHGELGSGSGSDTNDPSWTAEGLDFDGVDNYCTFSNFQTPSSGTWTVMVAFKSNRSQGTILSQNGAGGQAQWFDHNVSNQLRQFGVSFSPTALIEDGTITTGVWYLGYMRWNGTSLRLNLRRTGSNSTSATNISVMNSAPNLEFYLGSNLGSSRFFDGTTALMAHYNRALSDDEMTTAFDGIKAVLAPRGISL